MNAAARASILKSDKCHKSICWNSSLVQAWNEGRRASCWVAPYINKTDFINMTSLAGRHISPAGEPGQVK